MAAAAATGDDGGDEGEEVDSGTGAAAAAAEGGRCCSSLGAGCAVVITVGCNTCVPAAGAAASWPPPPTSTSWGCAVTAVVTTAGCGGGAELMQNEGTNSAALTFSVENLLSTDLSRAASLSACCSHESGATLFAMSPLLLSPTPLLSLLIYTPSSYCCCCRRCRCCRCYSPGEFSCVQCVPLSRRYSRIKQARTHARREEPTRRSSLLPPFLLLSLNGEIVARGCCCFSTLRASSHIRARESARYGTRTHRHALAVVVPTMLLPCRRSRRASPRVLISLSPAHSRIFTLSLSLTRKCAPSSRSRPRAAPCVKVRRKLRWSERGSGSASALHAALLYGTR